MSDRLIADPPGTVVPVRARTLIAGSVFWVGLGLLVGSALWYGRGLWFYSDEWNVVAAHHSGNWTQGFNGQWLLVPTAIFWVLVKFFGLFTYWPFRLVGLAWYTALVVVFHRWARRRVSPGVAALAALAIAWYPTSWNVVMMPLLMNFTIPVTMLFASFILIDRNRRSSDVGVAVCLLVGVTSSNVGLVVCVIVGVEFLLARVDWRRWWIFVPAAVVWVPWFGIWYEPIGPRAAVTHAAHWGIGLTENYALGFASGWRAGQWIWLAALTGVAVWALRRRRWNARGVGVFVGLVFFVAGASFRVADFHIPVPPDPNWYLWLYSVLVAALVVELCRGVRVPSWTLAVVGVVVVVGAFHLHRSLSDFHANGLVLKANARTWFAAADAVGDRASPDATLAVNIVQLPVVDYAGLRRDLGSLAPQMGAGLSGDEGTRRAADAWMASQLGVRIVSGAGVSDACRVLDDVSAPSGVMLPPGVTVRITTGAEATTLGLRRFADGFPAVPLGRVGPHRTVRLVVPPDDGALPWYLSVTPPAVVEGCLD